MTQILTEYQFLIIMTWGYKIKSSTTQMAQILTEYQFLIITMEVQNKKQGFEQVLIIQTEIDKMKLFEKYLLGIIMKAMPFNSLHIHDLLHIIPIKKINMRTSKRPNCN